MKKCVCVPVLLLMAAWSAGADVTMRVEVDATELPRRLLHTRMEVPAAPGTLALWYPKWVPGIHSPFGPVQNTAGIRFETPEGERLSWRRDPEEYYRLLVEVPAGVTHVVAFLDYICNQPSTNSIGVDSYGYPLFGVINWNTCLLYPEGYTDTEIAVRLRLRLPAGWRYSTALRGVADDDGFTEFGETTLRTVVDCPLIAGRHLRSIPLDTGDGPPAWLDLVSDSPHALQIDDDTIAAHGKLFREAYALYGGAPFPYYHLQVVLSDAIPGIGLEHLTSSLNAVGERDFVDAEKRKDRLAYLLAHELNHAWIGKHRRPAGMHTRNFHDPMHTELLWIYEGLDQYLGEVLMVRAGILSFDEYRERFERKLARLMHTEGRSWRPLRDTAEFAGPLRGGSRHWGHWRRGQDYYNEGLLIWLEVDAFIRSETDGRQSLDAFCRAFLVTQDSGEDIVPFTLEEVVEELNALVPRDWAAFFAERVDEPLDALPIDFVKLLGYRVEYNNTPSDYLRKLERDRNYVNGLEMIGIDVAGTGTISDVVPGSAADHAGLAPGMTVMGVNGIKFSPQRLRDGIADSVINRTIEFLLLEGEQFRTVSIAYEDGPRYLTLVRDGAAPDRFQAILKPILE